MRDGSWGTERMRIVTEKSALSTSDGKGMDLIIMKCATVGLRRVLLLRMGGWTVA